MRVLGIDEAGRGCVLGDLYVGAFFVEDPDDDVLRAAGAADSKALTPKRREEALARLRRCGTADVRTIPPHAIDGGNLNALEEALIAELVRAWRPDRVVVDALGHPSTLPKVIARLDALVGDVVRPEWVMEPKADATYPVVGAASVFAKVARDAALAALAGEHGALGSGYPSDPVTRRWLTEWNASGRDWPPFVRTRWDTIRQLSQQALF